MKVINKTANGRVFTCGKCNAIHIEYKNLNFNLSKKQYQHFANYLSDLDGRKWERKNKDSHFVRKIIIPTQDNSLNMILNNAELQEMKTLFGCNKPKDRNIIRYKNLEHLTCLN